MIYAVNEQTKEHRLYDGSNAPAYTGAGWRFIEADAAGWIPCNGSVCPLPYDARCDTKASYHSITIPDRDPKTADWRLVGLYRPILDANPTPWDGSGLPPVGSDCEVYEDQAWHFATIIAHHDDCAIAAIHRDDLSYEYGAYCGGAIRPIRSEEDKAVEEMTHCLGSTPYQTEIAVQEETCRALYRAGYRKTEDDA